jgi:hypothetical protein
MRRNRASVLAAALATAISAIAGACGKSNDAPTDGPTVDVRWAGTTVDSAHVRAPATAEWCDSLKLLQIQALRGDTGIAILLHPVKEFGAGRFRVVPPARIDSAPRAAAVALRWFAETSVRGFQGDSGAVIVEQNGSGGYGGTFELAAHSVTDPAHLTIRGSFRGLTLRPGGGACIAKPARSDSAQGVH